jgi:hypothetical protein
VHVSPICKLSKTVPVSLKEKRTLFLRDVVEQQVYRIGSGVGCSLVRILHLPVGENSLQSNHDYTT